MSKKKKTTSVELFSGLGGLSLGLGYAGCSHEALIEINEDACESIRINQKRNFELVKDWNVFQGDVKDFPYHTLKSSIELVAGGPPCQPFSLGGKHKGHEDERDGFPLAANVINTLTPKAFIFENVKGLLRASFAEYFEYVILRLTYPEITKKPSEEWQQHLDRLEKVHTKGKFDGLKYNVVFRLLNAADYGVPQHRERVFIVGFRSDLGIEWSFPKATHSEDELVKSKWVTGEYWDLHKVAKAKRQPIPPSLEGAVSRLSVGSLFKPDTQRWQTVRDALSGLPEPSREESKQSKFLNHLFRGGAKSYPGHTGSYIDEPSKTLKAGGHGVPGGENMLRLEDGTVRYFTVRESARIQTFPDDYFISGSWTESMRQIGNAVPVLLAKKVGESVLSQLGTN
jgi:DNA (cytosine-5)-methyltransferase 1